MVKVLVATTEGQGVRHDDYAWAVDGELVYIPMEHCGCPGCACGRGFVGLASNRAITTALVVDRHDLHPLDLCDLLADSLQRQGRLTPAVDTADAADGDDLLRPLFQRLLVAAAHFPVGSIIERDGHQVTRRAQAEPLHVPADHGAPGPGRSGAEPG
ncbi:MAG: hypothetical protein ACFCVK_04315 [Acidimicrobiales bacterium]